MKIRPEENGHKAEKRTKPVRDAGFLDIMRGCDCLDVFLLFFGIIFSMASGAVQPLGSVVFKGITDTLIASEANYTNGNLDLDEFKHQVLHYCLLYFVMGLCLFTVAYISNACLYTLCERRAAYIRKAYLRAVMRQNVAWFDENDAGTLTMRMSRGVEKIKEGAGDKLVIILSSFGCFVSGIAIGFTLCWQLSLVMMITVPLLLGTMYVSGKMLSGAAKREMAASSSAGSIAMEVLSGIRTVMAFNAQPQEVSRYGKQLESARDLGIRKAYVLAAFAAVPLCLMFAMMSIAFWYGTTLVVNGTVTPGTIFAVFWAVLLGTMRLGQAAPQLGVVLGARLAAKDIFSVIDRVPLIDSDRKDGIVPDKITGDIQVQDVHFSYPMRPEVKVLDGINLEVSAGQTVALVGPSGCGKSTILGFLQRFYEQDAGIITLDGIPLRDYNIRFLRSIVGVVQQEPVIFMATVAENIRMGDTSITDAQLEEICKQANAHEFVAKLIDGYNTIIGEGAIQLSGGQKQRIALARVLARQPKILLLDEATSALDSESEHVVTQALEKASRGRTTITVAHRLSTIMNSDKIFVFSHGQIVESGTHAELLEIEDGIYAKMIKAQEIAKGEEDTTLDDVDPIELTRGVATISADGTEEPIRLSQIDLKRASDRVRQSLVSNNAQEEQWLIESARYEMEQEGAMEASLTDIFRYSRPEMAVAILGLILTILRGLTWPIFSVIYGKLFKLLSELQAGGDASESISNSFMFLALSIYCGFTTFSSGSLFGIAGEKMASRLRLDVYKNLLRQDASYFDEQKHNVGTLTSRLSTDAPNVQAAIDQRLSEVLQGISSLIAGVSIAFYFGWNMAPIGLAAALMLVAAQSAVAQYLKFRGAKDMEVAVEATRLTTETILNVKCIQSLNRQNYMYASYCNAASKPFRRAVVRGMWQSFNLSLGMSFVNFNFAMAYAFGMMLVLHGWSTPFTIFQVIEALNMATFSVMAAASYFPEYIRARISAGVMFSMMKHQPRFDNMSHQGETPNLSGSISLKSVYFSYPTRPRCLILDGIGINAKFGQTVALVGSSGSGKSTVIQLLERFYDPLCGSVSADSYNIRDLSIQHWRSQIALVGQEPTLFDVSIRENIAYGMEDKLTQEQIEQAAKLANIHSFVASLPEGYETRVGPRGGRLSGGQKQRISIARAIVRNPKILLLDEATSALDADSQKVVQEALNRARLGRTCIVVAHRLSTIQNADLIIVCRDGRVVEQGTHITLMARKGFYYRLVEKQQH